MRRESIAFVGALVLLVGLSTITGSDASRPTATAARAPITATTLVCPDVSGSPPGTATSGVVANVAAAVRPGATLTGTVTATALHSGKSTTRTLHPAPVAVVRSQSKVVQVVAVTATGSLAATLAADQVGLTPHGRFRALSGARCAPPATDWWFAGADGRVGYTDDLVMANPAPTPAEVSVSLWSLKGRLSPPHLDSVQVPARSFTRIGIATIAPDQATLAVHVQVTSGSVSAALLDRRTAALKSDGGDFLPPTEGPAQHAVIAGFGAWPGNRTLVLADPGAIDATVALRLITPAGGFTPSGVAQVVVRAGKTRAVNLTKAFDGATGAVELTSDHPVVASGRQTVTAHKLRPDLSWLAATPPIVRTAAVADGTEPDGGQCRLLLTAPESTAQVRVATPAGHTRLITVRGGHSVWINITSLVATGKTPAAFTVTPVGSAPVYGARVLRFAGAHGALVTAEPLLSLPTEITLPVVQEDPSVGIR